jgi:putative toxin-antitoxin system antitoxin component (TIGR02293 family)
MPARPRLFTLIGLDPVSDLDLVKMIKAGLSFHSVSVLNENGLTFAEISETIIPLRTLKRRRSRNEPLSQKESDRVVRVARIISEAEAVFGSRDKALLWLRTPDDRLDNLTPLKVLVTGAAGRLIESLLRQIDEGIYA